MSDRSDIDGAVAAIRARSATLSGAERKVADYVLKEPTRTLHYNVAELARQSETSQAAVVRFCKRVGFPSFSVFKLCLARDVFEAQDERFLPDLELESDASPAQVVKSVLGGAQRGLSLLESLLEPEQLEGVASLILAASSTALFGLGASGGVAYDFFQKLLRIGLPVTYTFDTDLQLTLAASLKPSDLAFVVSYSGESAAMIEAAKQAKSRGATLVTLTMDGRNTIRGLADRSLLVPASERIYREGAGSSRINQLTVVDIIYSIILSKRLDTSIEALERSMQATHHRK